MLLMLVLIAMAGDPLRAALRLTNNSGTEVANETTVIPITNFDMLNLNDNPTDALTKNSPPITRDINPRITNKKLIVFLANIKRKPTTI